MLAARPGEDAPLSPTRPSWQLTARRVTTTSSPRGAPAQLAQLTAESAPAADPAARGRHSLCELIPSRKGPGRDSGLNRHYGDCEVMTMALRPSWSGFLKFNLVSVPVKGYSATASGGGKIGFHLLHRGCHQRIRYKKVCPVHGEIPNDEIVSGYEYAKGQYVTVEAEEKKGLQSEDDKAIQVDAFVPPGAIDPLYYSGRSYYLLPDGKPGAQPYAVLLDAMSAQE